MLASKQLVWHYVGAIDNREAAHSAAALDQTRPRRAAVGLFTYILPVGAIIGPIVGGVFVTD